MKRKAIGAIAVILLLVLFAWWLVRPKATPRDQVSSASQKGLQQASKATDGPPSATLRKGEKEQPTDFQRTWEETMRKAYATPMDMYGLVLDEHDQPIEGATAKFSWNPIHGDTLTATATSDAGGHFSFTGRRGISLGVDVSKPGYYQMRNEDASRRNFDFYAPPGKAHYTSDPNHPTIFRLKKVGDGAPMVRRYIDINLPSDDSTIIDLNTGQVSPTGDLEFTMKRSRSELPFAWEAQARIMNGGCQRTG